MGDLKNNFLFSDNVIVHQQDGKWRHVRNCRAGDEIFSYDETNTKDIISTIVSVSEVTLDSVLILNLKNGVIVTTSPEHSFYIIDRGWVLGSDLEVGIDCIKIDGYRSTITNIEIKNDIQKMYSLEIDNDNLYANGLLIKNK